MDKDIVPIYIVITGEPDSEILGAYFELDEALIQANLHGAYVAKTKTNVTTVRSAYRG